MARPENNLPDNSLGSFVWWDLSDTQIRPAQLRELLEKCEYQDVDVPEISPSSAIRRACSKWGQGRGKADRYRAEVVFEDASEVVVGIMHREQRAKKEAGWDQVESVVFNVQLNKWTDDRGGDLKATVSGEIERFISQADTFRLFLDVHFIRPEVIARELGAMSRISLRGQGGIYFVPGVHIGRLRKLKNFVDQLGYSRLHLAHVGTDGDSVQSIMSSVSEHVIRGLRAVEGELTKWEASSRKTRTDSSARILGDLAGLKDLAGLYEGALSTSLVDLRNEIEGHRLRAIDILADEVRS